MELVLNRNYHVSGTNGELLLNGAKVCSTIELPWKNNASRISCIPEGRYELVKRFTPRFGHHFILLNVPKRSYILLHAANDALKEIKGCIAPVTFLTGEGKGSESRKALKRLVELLYPSLDLKKKVFLIIQSKKNGVNNKKDEQANTQIL